MLSKKSKAIGFIIMSAFGFAMMAAFIRLAGDLPFTQKTFFRNLVAVAVAAVVLCREKVGFKWEKGNLPLLIIRATCGTLGIFCNYYAIDHLVLADANILNKMSPFFAIIFSLILLKERASVFQYAAVLAAFGSSMLIIKPGFSSACWVVWVQARPTPVCAHSAGKAKRAPASCSSSRCSPRWYAYRL